MESQIRAIKNELLRTGDGDAIEMISAIYKRAESDTQYADTLNGWLTGKLGTVELRDVLCAPFKSFSFVKTSTRPMPWFNMFAAIDTAALKVAQ